MLEIYCDICRTFSCIEHCNNFMNKKTLSVKF